LRFFAFEACTFIGTQGKILIMETQGNTMNIYTKQIMELLGVHSITALQIQEILESEVLDDLSECTERQFRQAVRTAYNYWLEANNVEEIG